VHLESHVELPKGYSPELPKNVDLKEDFAEYHATYAIKDGMLLTQRAFLVKLREVPVSKYELYKKLQGRGERSQSLYRAVFRQVVANVLPGWNMELALQR